VFIDADPDGFSRGNVFYLEGEAEIQVGRCALEAGEGGIPAQCPVDVFEHHVVGPVLGKKALNAPQAGFESGNISLQPGDTRSQILSRHG
jgi:hypothetical protein